MSRNKISSQERNRLAIPEHHETMATSANRSPWTMHTPVIYTDDETEDVDVYSNNYMNRIPQLKHDAHS